jgi:DNA repair protein RadC
VLRNALSLSHESLRVVLLNAKQHLIKVVSVSEGTLNKAVAHPREIFKSAIIHSAYGFILTHNLWVATHNYVMWSAELCAVCRRTAGA